ncbi:MAG: hypothetical protein VX730_06960 [Pseudomonadota bacterium]|nr:hypothetical protein [Pseudomonadota bacterium]
MRYLLIALVVFIVAKEGYRAYERNAVYTVERHGVATFTRSEECATLSHYWVEARRHGADVLAQATNLQTLADNNCDPAYLMGDDYAEHSGAYINPRTNQVEFIQGVRAICTSTFLKLDTAASTNMLYDHRAYERAKFNWLQCESYG